MNYAVLAIEGVLTLVQDAPEIASSIQALLAPIKEDRAPTEAEWEAAKATVDQADQEVQAG